MKQPWPSDAIMIIASKRGEENQANMETVVLVECRDCQAKLAADSFTIRRGNEIAGQTGNRPVKFFCIPCAVKYDRASVVYIEDHRGRI